MTPPVLKAQCSVLRVLDVEFRTPTEVASRIEGPINAGACARVLRALVEKGLVEQAPVRRGAKGWMIYGYRRVV